MSTPPPESAPSASISGKPKKRLLILVVLSILGLVILKMSFIFFFIGMLPAMVAFIVDHDPKKYTASTVSALNFSGVFPYMMDIFIQGGTYDAIGNEFYNPVIWLVMYGAAALGWAIVYFSPIIAAALLEGLHSGRVLQLELQQKSIAEEWGKQITGEKENEESK